LVTFTRDTSQRPAILRQAWKELHAKFKTDLSYIPQQQTRMGHILFPTFPPGVFLDAMSNHSRFHLVYDQVHQLKRKPFQQVEFLRARPDQLILRAGTLDPGEQIHIT
jgi:hypothetical protein